MVNLVIYFRSNALPNRDGWEENARTHRIPLSFWSGFEPTNHPICGDSQVDHPKGLVTARLGEATGQFQLDLHRLTADTKEWLRSYDLQAFDSYNFSAAFRWSEFRGADSLIAQLAAATLASATGGAVLWQRAKGGFLVGEEAFKSVSNAGFNEAKRRAGSDYKFSKKDIFGPVMNVETLRGDWITCPRCGNKFKITSAQHWDGQKHLTCGQLIVPTLGSI